MRGVEMLIVLKKKERERYQERERVRERRGMESGMGTPR